MDVEKSFNFSLGTQVIIELQSGIMIDGIIDHYNQNFIKLRNCHNHYSGAILHSKRLYRCQINNILTLDDTDGTPLNEDLAKSTSANSSCSTEETESEHGSSPTINAKASPSTRILLSRDEYLRLQNLTKTFVYMAIVDSRYYDAVDVLRNCETIGMSGFIEGAQNLSVLALSSWDKVYIFDIQEFNRSTIPLELHELLEMPSIEKVTHHGRQLVICLRQFYKIEVKNLFDTQVADFKIRMQQEPEVEQFTVRKINEILRNYLHFPDNIIRKYGAIDWKHRPIDPDYRRYAAESVAYVITIKNTLERILLKDFYSSVSKYTKGFDCHSALELSEKFSRTTVHRKELAD